MNLCVASSWDDELLEGLSQINSQNGTIHELFGSLRQSLTGSGHSSVSIRGKCNTREEVENYVRKIHSHGFKFNYTLNASCLQNMEYDKEGHRELIEHIEWIDDIADAITVAIPYLVQLIKDKFSIDVVVSTIASVNSIREAQFYETLGADRITMNMVVVNRNFELLENLKNSVHCSIELMLNDGCLFRCPYRYYHYNCGSHASQEGNLFYMDYSVLRCCLDRLHDLVEYLKIPWIRPEDVKEYEKYAEYFKIAGREKPTSWLLNCAKAYSNRTYDGNLLDLLTLVTPASHEIGRLMLGKPPEIYIDNKSLDGFIDEFKKNSCLNCDTCGYCESVAKEVIKVDQSKLDSYVQELEKYIPFILHFDEPQFEKMYDRVRMVYETSLKGNWKWKLIKSVIKAFRR